MLAYFFVRNDNKKTQIVAATPYKFLFVLFILITGANARADKITSILTARDLAHPLVLSASGQLLSATTRSGSAGGSSTTPTYVAYALSGGEHLPSDISTLTATSGAGSTTTGPLDFTPSPETSLASALATSNSALVQTSSQEYLVSYLPRLSQASSGSTSSSSSSTSTTSSSWNLGPLSVNNINGIPISEISKVVNTGSKDISSVTSQAVGDLGKWLDIDNSHRSVSRPSLNLEVASSSSTGQQEAQVLEVPAPEPGTWLIFGILIGAAGVSERLRGRARRLRSPLGQP